MLGEDGVGKEIGSGRSGFVEERGKELGSKEQLSPHQNPFLNSGFVEEKELGFRNNSV